MKKRVLSLFLSLPLLVTSLYGVPAIHAVEEEESAIQTQMETSVTNDLNKLHFYFDVEEYATIDSLTELNEATEYVTQKAEAANLTRNVSASAGTDELRLTVCFASDIKETSQYQEFLAERENLDSMEEVRDFRHRLNSYSKAYHEELVLQNMSLLADLEYNEIQTIDYSPYVVLKTTAAELENSALYGLAVNENVVNICVAEETEILENSSSISNGSENAVSVEDAFRAINAYDDPEGVYECGDYGYRLDRDAIFDYQISTHLIGVINSAGNVSSSYQNYITSPGYAFNVITVGGVRYSSNEWISHNGLSHDSFGFPQVKPNVVAPSEILIEPTETYPYQEGTSFSTALVTGCVALLLEKRPTYINSPDLVFSLIHSTAQETDDYVADVGFFDDETGAGMIDLQRLLDNCDTHVRYNNRNDSSGTVFYSEYMNLSSGKEFQVALSWFVDTSTPVNGVVSNIYLTDYDIYLVNSFGDVVMKESLLTDSNIELIRYTIELSGSYYIEVRQTSAKNPNNSADMLNLTYNCN